MSTVVNKTDIENEELESLRRQMAENKAQADARAAEYQYQIESQKRAMQETCESYNALRNEREHEAEERRQRAWKFLPRVVAGICAIIGSVSLMTHELVKPVVAWVLIALVGVYLVFCAGTVARDFREALYE